MRYIWFVLALCLAATMMIGSLALALETKPPLPPVPKPYVIEGTITAVFIAGESIGKVTIKPANSIDSSATITFLVNAKTVIYKDGKLVKLTDLAVTDLCRAMVAKTSEGSILAQLVYAKTVVPPLKWAKGKIVEKTLWNAQRTFRLELPATTTTPAVRFWFSITDATRIIVDGKAANYDKLAVGQSAEVSYAQPPPTMTPVELPIPAKTISAKNPPVPIVRILGKLVGVDLENRTISVLPRDARCTDPAKCAVTILVNDGTKVNKMGEAKLADLTLGDMVDVTAKGSIESAAAFTTAVLVVVMPETFMGTVAGVIVDDATGTTGTLLVQGRLLADVIAEPAAFKVVPATRITKNGVLVPLAKLEKGNYANVRFYRFGDTNVAALVEARAKTVIKR